jgi:hypothetical protein
MTGISPRTLRRRLARFASEDVCDGDAGARPPASCGLLKQPAECDLYLLLGIHSLSVLVGRQGLEP